MSGNKLKLYILCFTLCAMSCSAARRSASKKPPKQEKKEEHVLKGEDKRKQEEEIKKKKKHAPEFVNDFNVALLLPFNLNKEPEPGTPEWNMMTIVTDYYQGINLALDSLKREGINLRLHVFDTQKDSALTVNLLKKTVFDSLDMIIGPLDKGSFSVVSAFARKKGIPVISPFSSNEPDSLNPFVFYCNPALTVYARELAGYLGERQTEKAINVIYVSDNKYVDQQFFKAFTDSISYLGVKVTRVNATATIDLQKHMVSTDSMPNYIVVPTDEEETATKVFNSLRGLEGYVTYVVGLESWQQFRNQDYKHWERYHLLMLSNYFADEKAKNYHTFWYQFRDKYTVVPSEFALRGFDHMLFFGHSLLAFGKYFPPYVQNTRFDATHNDFYWHFNGLGNLNHSVNILQFRDYRFIRVND